MDSELRCKGLIEVGRPQFCTNPIHFFYYEQKFMTSNSWCAYGVKIKVKQVTHLGNMIANGNFRYLTCQIPAIFFSPLVAIGENHDRCTIFPSNKQKNHPKTVSEATYESLMKAFSKYYAVQNVGKACSCRIIKSRYLRLCHALLYNSLIHRLAKTWSRGFS